MKKIPEVLTPKSLLRDLGEFALIERLTRHFATPALLTGPGDDCAIIEPDAFGEAPLWQLFTTDTMVENQHFRIATIVPHDLGWKALAAASSDIAAMGGEPKGFLVSLQLRADLELAWVEELYRGLAALASRYNITLLGGNCSRAEEIAITISVWGVSKKPPLKRSGAQHGDDLWISGEIGGAARGLGLLEGKYSLPPDDVRLNDLTRRHRVPVPRIELGCELLYKDLATSLIDVSDGLLQDAGHIAKSSNVIVSIDTNLVPIPTSVPGIFFSISDAMCGGEDYELLFTASPAKRDAIALLAKELPMRLTPDLKLTRIGTVRELSLSNRSFVELVYGNNQRKEAEQWLAEAMGGTRRGGFDHFSQ